MAGWKSIQSQRHEQDRYQTANDKTGQIFPISVP
jgi:hypothetical protein